MDRKLEIILAAKDEATRVVENASRRIESTVGNMQRSISSMASTALGAVGGIYALSKAWEQVNEAARAQQQAVAFTNMAKSYGSGSKEILRSLKEVSRGTIATADLIQDAGRAMMLGIQPEKLSELMRIARATSKLTGQTISEAFNDITLAVGRQSKMILDNLGIIVSVGQANAHYAAALGKTVSQLTDAEKKQAFLNEAVEKGNDLVERMGDQADTAADSIDQMAASYENLAMVIATAGLNSLQQFDQAWGLSSIKRKITEIRDLIRLLNGEIGLDRIYLPDVLYGPKSPKPDLFKMSLDQTEHTRALQKLQALQTRELDAFLAKEKDARLKAYNDFLGIKKNLREEAYQDELADEKKLAEEVARLQQQALKSVTPNIPNMAEELEKALGDPDAYFGPLKKATEKATTAMNDEFQNAMQGWASSWSGTLNDMLWGADMTFGDILRSFGKMLTQMYIQKDILEPLFGGGGNGGGLLAGLGESIFNSVAGGGLFFHQGGVVGETPAPVKPIPASMFFNAPRLHSGLMPDEYPAILQRGEIVLPRNIGGSAISKGEGAITYNKIVINAIDANSFRDLVERDPQAITSVVSKTLRDGGLRNEIREATA